MSKRSAATSLTSWWDKPDQFDWVTDFLGKRGLLRSAQLIMAVVSASSALAPIAVLTAPRTLTPGLLAIAATAALFAGAMTLFWLTRWPTKTWSQLAAVAGILFIASWSLTQPDPAVGALGCTALAITGGYLGFFHNTQLMALNFVTATCVGAFVTYRLAVSSSVATAVSAFWLIWLLNIAVPVAIRGISHAMTEYATRSGEDPLTGLLNRRGLFAALHGELNRPHPADAHLTVVMVDLDDFKRINDTEGHDAGDQALSAVAELLRRHAPRATAISRIGGEEFLVASISNRPHSSAPGRELCQAISDLPHTLTASIGLASIPLHELGGAQSADAIDALIATADAAMYHAKRRGGNQIHYA